MTRTFNAKIRCPKCGHEHTLETDFERWMRENKEKLHSIKDSLVRFDLDLLLHKYKWSEDGKGSREVQCMMFIEVKTHNAKLEVAQKDTLGLLDQLLRNRKPNIHSKPRRQVERQPTVAFSRYANKNVSLWLMGGHVLTLSGTDPMNSETMTWDKSVPITVQELEELLRFERDPDRPRLKLDIRRRSQSWPKDQYELNW